MVRFSCFHSHIHGQKTKKQSQPSFETMIKMLQVGSQGKAGLSSSNPGSLDQSPSAVRSNYESGNDGKSSQENYLVECGPKFGEINNDSNNARVSPMRQFRRSLSLGCNLQEEGRIIEENNSDEYTDQQSSWNGSHDQQNNLPTPVGFKSPVASITDQDQEEASVEPLNYSCSEVNHESIFCLGDQQYPEKEGHESCPVDGEVPVGSGIRTPQSQTKIVKSLSLPNLQSMLSRSGVNSPSGLLAYRNRSSEDLNVLMTRKETCAHDLSVQQFAVHNEDYLYKSDKCTGQDGVPDGYEESYKYSASNRDWIVPASDDEVYGAQTFQGESSSLQQHQFPNEDFKMKWIEDWVSEIQECSPIDEIIETKKYGSVEKTSEIPASLDVVNRVSLVKEEANLNPSMLAAKRYISSLNAGVSTAQLANLGLTVIPFLSAFVSLKVVNLSGNSIVRITAGALPRGLHMLNLSKNKISTIEGLRELTRLRILDLSYNRITRIGHGLASCSTLKELYLAGNKISEVEGLHRLLKLAVLDLRFNKISTSKCLGQLAANYNSLQAISLEGNPAQKNVGDEQLKKHLQGLLPHLAYYNRQTIKSNSLKDSSERSVRLGMAAHQFDRGHKSDHKSVRRASHGSASLKQSSVHGKVDSPKWSRSKHGFVPPPGSRTSQRHHHHHHQPPLELSMKPLVLSDFGMKKSQSVGALAAL